MSLYSSDSCQIGTTELEPMLRVVLLDMDSALYLHVMWFPLV